MHLFNFVGSRKLTLWTNYEYVVDRTLLILNEWKIRHHVKTSKTLKHLPNTLVLIGFFSTLILKIFNSSKLNSLVPIRRKHPKKRSWKISMKCALYFLLVIGLYRRASTRKCVRAATQWMGVDCRWLLVKGRGEKRHTFSFFPFSFIILSSFFLRT